MAEYHCYRGKEFIITVTIPGPPRPSVAIAHKPPFRLLGAKDDDPRNYACVVFRTEDAHVEEHFTYDPDRGEYVNYNAEDLPNWVLSQWLTEREEQDLQQRLVAYMRMFAKREKIV